jgi:hypothetical protein
MYEIQIHPPRELREMYIAEAEAELLEIEYGLRRREWGCVAASAARLVDASVGAGAELVAAIAAELEARAFARDVTLAAHLLVSLEQALVHARRVSDGDTPTVRLLTRISGGVGESSG